jgi:ABC-type transport system involved in multi-copper enzyme maturation permease subunit
MLSSESTSSSKAVLVSSLFFMAIIIYFVIISPPQVSFANHGQEITITEDLALFRPLTAGGNQVNVLVNYTANDPSIVGQMANSVMKVYTTNRTLIKTSSSAEGFIVNQTGFQRHATTIADSSLREVIAVVQYTDLAKTIPLSNPLRVDLTLNQTGIP